MQAMKNASMQIYRMAARAIDFARGKKVWEALGQNEAAYWHDAGWKVTEIDDIHRPYQKIAPALDALGFDVDTIIGEFDPSKQKLLANKVADVERQAKSVRTPEGKPLPAPQIYEPIREFVEQLAVASPLDVKAMAHELKGTFPPENLYIPLKLVQTPGGGLAFQIKPRLIGAQEIDDLASRTKVVVYTFNGEIQTWVQLQQALRRGDAPFVESTDEESTDQEADQVDQDADDDDLLGPDESLIDWGDIVTTPAPNPFGTKIIW
jgi:hypothetical protein